MMKDRRVRSSPLLRILLVLVSLSLIEKGLSTVAANQLFGSERNHQQQSRYHSIRPPPTRPEWQITGRGGADFAVNGNDNPESSPGDTPKQEQESPSPPITARPTSGGKNTFLPNYRLMPKMIRQKANNLQQHLKHGADVLIESSAQAGPSVVTACTLLYTCDKGVSLATLYALALLGASSGFYLFLYFITIGYAVGVTLPLAVALYVHSKYHSISRPTFLHSLLTVLWGVRILVFFVWREYISWPALHQKVVELQSKMVIPFASKLLCWLVYSFFYVAMITPCWSRLQGHTKRWGLVGYAGILLQMCGLLLESIADLQKSGFKQQYRHAWCNVGVWKWSSHPNYLGEGMFWWGTYLAHGFGSILHSLLATIGLIFITIVLKQSTRALTRKHMEKYGDQPEFCEFQRSHAIWGSKTMWGWIHGMEELFKSYTTVATTAQVLELNASSITSTTSLTNVTMEEELQAQF